MIQKVSNAEEINIFNQIWMYCWHEKGYEIQFSEKTLGRFIVSDSDNNFVGTVEFKSYCHSDIEENFAFSRFDYIKTNKNNTVELDKLSILPEKRGKNVLSELLTLITDFAFENKVRYYIALIEPKLFLTLKRFYKVPVMKLGPSFYYKGDDVVPMCLDAEIVYNEKEKYKWYIPTSTLVNQ